ncbi:MFS transporter [Sulfuriroseicoccus oceanibius]|uniref:MFS transporter n=2 Tax=Sulfuriroseicoccus oceanibius TaxID=2707525 RepID=A0A6B3L6F5_9BACT|nr:MFS transporter [Sulfuriroseicoccus oceanibius]
MPGGIPYIISNEAAERFSFYGMKAALAIFLANYLGVMGGTSMSETEATSYVSFFNSAVYFTPILGAILSDVFLGKYKTIISLSIVYCLGHLALAFMGIGGVVQFWLLSGLGLIALGAGGIKSCVSAHVGDQFGRGNAHLLTKIFNIFYLSINFGAVVSNLAIPLILKWHGPHWAFGIPGVLMALATVAFWMGRNKFIHVPPHGRHFFDELFSRDGRSALFKLIPLFLFVAVFWCLFDQTASTLVFQAEKMDLNVFGITVLPSQIQAANPFLILVLIPLFTWGVYPLVGKIVPLTPLRKIGAGLFLMAVAFAVTALAQESIDAGNTPSVWWQILAYVILTAGEVMVSIVCLEFAYTQSPKKIKSFVMSLYLLSVFAGNLITGIVNIYIPAPTPEFDTQGTNIGLDQQAGTLDDLQRQDNVIVSAVTDDLQAAAQRVITHFDTQGELPESLDNLPLDPWGNPLTYQRLHTKQARIVSMGPDAEPTTQWDLGVTLEVHKADEYGEGTWLYEQRKKQQMERSVDKEASSLTTTWFAGGQPRLEGAAYFWFFTKLMLGTAIVFIPFAMAYKPKTYLQDPAGDHPSAEA